MPSTINLQNVQIKNGSTWYTMCPFPIGFIYLSQNSTSPATTFGGTWAALNEDRFLRPSNAWTTGGSKKISTKQLPAHSHNIAAFPNDGSGSSGNVMNVAARDSWGYFLYNTSCQVGEVEETGGGQITGLITAIATVGIELLNFYLLDGGEQ